MGSDRVRMALASFDDRWDSELGAWDQCFLARAFGQPCALKERIVALMKEQPRLNGWERAALVMGISDRYSRFLADLYDDKPALLREECVLFLAEHGSHPEPAVKASLCESTAQ